MKLFDNETENRDYLFEKLKDNEKLATQECFISKEMPVPYKHVYIPVRNTLEIWCSKQNICFIENCLKKLMIKNIVVNSNEETVLKINLENDVRGKDIGMPFVIIDTKMPNANTHELLASSEKIKMIIAILSYCKCFLFIFGSLPSPRIHRL